MKISFDIYNVAGVVAGFYVGYNEGKGVDVRDFVEYVLEYGPTAAAMIMTPVIISGVKKMNRFAAMGTRRDLLNKLKTRHTNVDIRKYNSALDNLDQQYEKMNNQGLLKPAVRKGVFVAGNTAIGYTAGRLCSQLF